MNLNHRTKLLRMVEDSIEAAYQKFDDKEVKILIGIVENSLGFRLKAQELKEEYL